MSLWLLVVRREISCNGWAWQTPACTELLWDSIAGSRYFPPIEKLLAAHNVTRNATDPHWLATKMHNCMGHAAQVWNAVMSNVTANIFNDLAVTPLHQQYPGARANQYGFYDMQNSLCVLDPGGYEACLVSTYNGSVVGSHQTLSLYNNFPGNGAKVISENG